MLKHAAAEDLIAAVRAAAEGKRPPNAAECKVSNTEDAAALTVRQGDIVSLVARGLTAKEIASVLGLSVRTVEFHKYRAMETLGVSTSAELIRFAIERGMAKP